MELTDGTTTIAGERSENAVIAHFVVALKTFEVSTSCLMLRLYTKPGAGVHSKRFSGFALHDYFMTFTLCTLSFPFLSSICFHSSSFILISRCCTSILINV
ncbi:hypothetical protein Mapa_004285 [Marchantia paleacea]|nr:hypothetical protein Mapa_004285 [Marchantia paleacea]